MVIDSFTGQYAFLSNFYICDVCYKGSVFQSAEHAFQSAKASTVRDYEYIRFAPTCKEAKRRGGQIRLRKSWERIKESIMLDILRDKFTRNMQIGYLLIGTGSTKLVEGNNWSDCYWGVCRGIGKNKLGILLMRVRREIGKAENRECDESIFQKAD